MTRLLSVALLLVAGRLAAADGAAVFESNCAACHGADGRAQTPQGRKLKARDLRDSKLTAAEIERQVRAGSLARPGGKAAMPAFGTQLSDDEIRAVVARVLQFRD